MRKPLLPLLLAGVLTLGVAACGGDDDVPAATGDTTTTTSTTVAEDSSSTTTSTTAPGSTTTTSAFNGSTTPTSAPPPPNLTETALLADVRVGTDDEDVTRIVFEFEEQVPGFDIEYVDPPILADASGEPVQVDGAAFLQIRMEPASGVDLSSGDAPVETYTGPDRVSGSDPVEEVVRTGDFEANLTWVAGMAEAVPFRVHVLASPGRIVIELPGS